MRTFASPIFVAAGLAAFVSSPDTAQADTVPFASLPLAAAFAKTDPPAAPEKVAASEHTEGIYPAILPAAQRKAVSTAGV